MPIRIECPTCGRWHNVEGLDIRRGTWRGHCPACDEDETRATTDDLDDFEAREEQDHE